MVFRKYYERFYQGISNNSYKCLAAGYCIALAASASLGLFTGTLSNYLNENDTEEKRSVSTGFTNENERTSIDNFLGSPLVPDSLNIENRLKDRDLYKPE